MFDCSQLCVHGDYRGGHSFQADHHNSHHSQFGVGFISGKNSPAKYDSSTLQSAKKKKLSVKMPKLDFEQWGLQGNAVLVMR
jgi:hypothetical protein